MPAKSKSTRIKEELTRLQAKFEFVDGNQREIVAQLLQNAAFMAVTLQDLQEIINTQGATDEYRNGATQYGTKASATLQAYNSTVKNYTNVIAKLAQLVPPEQKEYKEPEKTPEEIEAEEAEREERDRRTQEEIRQAVLYQTEMKERDNNGQPYISFTEWRNKKGTL